MVDFILLTQDQSLVDQLKPFELAFDVCESIDMLKHQPKDSILFLDLANSNFKIDEVAGVLPTSFYVVAIFHGQSKKEVKQILDKYSFLYAHLNLPLIKSDILHLLQDLSIYVTQKKSNKTSLTTNSQKFDLEFSLFEDDIKELPVSESLDAEAINKFSKKLGNFNFLENKNFNNLSEENLRIQQKFNIVFSTHERSGAAVTNKANNDSLDLNNYQVEDDLFQDEDMNAKNKKNGLDFNLPKLDFDEAVAVKKEDTQQRSSLDFDLEFGESDILESGQDAEIKKALDASKKAQSEVGKNEAVDLSFEDDFGLEIESQASNDPEATNKTIVFDRNSLKSSAVSPELKAEDASSLDFSSLEDDSVDSLSLPQSSEIPSSGIELGTFESDEDFSLDTSTAKESGAVVDFQTNDAGGFELSELEEELVIENNSAKKKVEEAPEKANIAKSKTNSLDLDLENDNENFDTTASNLENVTSGDSLNTSDYMSSVEARVNIENTIKDIIKPDLSQSLDDKTGDLDLSQFAAEEVDEESEKTLVADPSIFKNSFDDQSDDELGSQFDYGKPEMVTDRISTLDDISFETGDRGKKVEAAINETRSNIQIPNKFESVQNSHLVFKNVDDEDLVVTQSPQSRKNASAEDLINSEKKYTSRYQESVENYRNDDDYVRAQATIRQIREELDEQLIELKQLRRENKELEQENLSLRAQTDELKIEQSILRKRHLSDSENLKYQLQLSEEKRLTAEERLRLSEKNRENLEQKLRLDFSQIRQREKELENQLELLSIDHDSQVQTRDSKILELRRKIESLEFNMETSSIREQKTNDDKKKLEDKLVKIMKTLRHSIENIDEGEYFSSFDRAENSANNDEE